MSNFNFNIYFFSSFLLHSQLQYQRHTINAWIAGNIKSAIDNVIITISLAIIFTGLQYFEYSEAGFMMSHVYEDSGAMSGTK